MVGKITFSKNDPVFSFSFRSVGSLSQAGALPFLGLEVMKSGCSLNTKVYKKPTHSGLLSHYHSHMDGRYKHSPLNTMRNHAFKLSSIQEFFKRNVNASKRPLFDCATQTILCSLPSANSSSQKCLKTHVRKYLRSE